MADNDRRAQVDNVLTETRKQLPPRIANVWGVRSQNGLIALVFGCEVVEGDQSFAHPAGHVLLAPEDAKHLAAFLLANIATDQTTQ